MPTPFIMPKMDMDQESVVIIEWLKTEGDVVEKGETVVVVETDKVTSEVEAPASGHLAGILYHANQEVPVTEVIAYILGENESMDDLPKGQQASPDEAAQPEVVKEPGKPITPLAKRIADVEGIDLEKVQSKNHQLTKKEIFEYLESVNQVDAGDKISATPAARRIAREIDHPLDGIKGSGPRGRIQAIDVKSFSEVGKPATLIEMSTMSKRIADRLTESYQSTPHIFLTVEVNMRQLEHSRKTRNQFAEKNGLSKVSLTAYLTRIVAWCLKRHPILNSSIDDDVITIKENINVGIATALDEGLIVPVIHNADGLTIAELNEKIMGLTNQARAGDLNLQDVQGGTFTITNLGMYGIDTFTAIINPPQVAILAVGAIKRKPVVIDEHDTLLVCPMMNIILGADHRVIDGAVAANFVADLVNALEMPSLLLE